MKRYVKDLYSNWFNTFNSIRLHSKIDEDRVILSIELGNEIIYEKEIYGKWIVDNIYDTTEFRLFDEKTCYKHKDLLEFISCVSRDVESRFDFYKNGKYYDSIIYKDNILKFESNNKIYISFSIPVNDNVRNNINVDLSILGNTLKRYVKHQLRNIKGGVIKVEQLCKILDE
jgi:hypothetical protein